MITSSFLKRAVGVALVVVIGLGASGCVSGQARVATVNGTAVHSKRFLQGAKVLSGLEGKPVDDNALAIPNAAVTEYAGYLIQGELIDQLLAKRHLEVTDATIQSVRETLEGQQGPPGFKKTPKWFQDDFIRPRAAYQTLIDDYSKGIDKAAQTKAEEAQAKKVYDANPEQFAQSCVSIIVTPDQATATAAKAQITDDASFVTVAKAVATPNAPAQGDKQDGDLGCIPTSNLQGALLPAEFAKFAAAADGTVVGPYSLNGGGFIIINKHSEKQQTFAEVKATLIAQIQQQGTPGQLKAQEAVIGLLKSAKIEVNPKYGSWDPEKNTIVPPAGAEQPDGKSSLTSLTQSPASSAR